MAEAEGVLGEIVARKKTDVAVRLAVKWERQWALRAHPQNRGWTHRAGLAIIKVSDL